MRISPPHPLAGHERGEGQPVYGTWSWTGEAPVDGKALCEALVSLPEDVLRAKGILHLREDPAHRYILQLVGRSGSIQRERAWSDETPASRIVLIGVPESIDLAGLDALMTRLTG